MKNVRSLFRTMCALAVCCAVLCTTAFAKGPVKTYELGGTTVTIGFTDSSIMSRAARTYTLYDDIITTSRNRKISDTFRPEDGTHFHLGVTNVGDSSFRLLTTLTVNGQTITDETVLKAGEGPYVSSGDLTKYNCDFTIEVRPMNGEKAVFEFLAFQK